MRVQKNFAAGPLFAALIIRASVALKAQSMPVTRLDGTKGASSQIDATVAQAMEAAHVSGLGIAIFNHGCVLQGLRR